MMSWHYRTWWPRPPPRPRPGRSWAERRGCQRCWWCRRWSRWRGSSWPAPARPRSRRPEAVVVSHRCCCCSHCCCGWPPPWGECLQRCLLGSPSLSLCLDISRYLHWTIYTSTGTAGVDGMSAGNWSHLSGSVSTIYISYPENNEWTI